MAEHPFLTQLLRERVRRKKKEKGRYGHKRDNAPAGKDTTTSMEVVSEPKDK